MTLTPMEKRRALNGYGVKSSCDMWRTINGVAWPHWTTVTAPDLVAAYRAAGVRCRRFADEIFIHPDDQDAARAVDSSR